MPSNKDRLYLALYAHSRPDAFHWAFLVSPKNAPDDPNRTTRYHATNNIVARDGTPKPTWRYEHVLLPSVKTAKLLVRVLIGKVEKSAKKFDASLGSVPIVQDDTEWRCRTWTINAMTALVRDKILSDSSITDWTFIEAECRAYVQRKKDDGRFNVSTPTIPTYDLMAKVELVP